MSNKIENWKQANKIYSDMLDLSAHEALVQLNTLQDMPADVKKIVKQLITAGNKSCEFVEKELIAFPEITTGVLRKINTGDELDQYQLLEEIGQGGMSRVFKAKRLNIENQKYVAIKIFNSPENNQLLLERFISEQKILSALSHPNIITMHHGGTTEQGVSFLVMELLEGSQDIDAYVEKNHIKTKQIIKLLLKAADAISYAHSQLVIHRDIKPSNIVINENGELKVVDFGIAKLINPEKQGNDETIMALTPSYASPEQVNSKNISIQTDIFSLALVAIKLITGKSPFSTDRLMKSCVDDEQQITQALKNTKFDKDLRNILNKALMPNPQHRYNNMQQFADDLIAWLKHEPVTATSNSYFYQVSKFAKRRSALFATLVTLFITLSLGLIIMGWQYNKIKIEANKAQQVKNFMLDSFESTDPDINKGEELSPNQILNIAALKLQNSDNIDKEIKFELLQTIGISYGKIGSYDLALKYIAESLKINPQDSKSISYQLKFLYDTAQYEVLNKKLSDLQDGDIDLENRSRIQRVRARLLAKNAEFDKAQKLVESLIKKLQSSQHEKILNSRLLAELYFYQSKPKQSIEIIKSVLSRPEINKTHVDVMELRKDLTEYLIEIGEYQQALEELLSLIKIQKKILGEKHPSIAKTLKLLATSYMQLGDIKHAQEALTQSYQLNQQIFGNNSIQAAYDLNTLAILSHQVGDLNKAIDLMYQAVKIFETEKALDFSDTLELKANLASLLNINNQSEQAKKILLEVLHIQLNKLGEYHDSTLYTKKLLAYTLSKLNQHKQAIELIDATTKLAIQNYDIKHPIIVSLFYNQAKIYKRAGQTQKALDKFLEILKLKLLEEKQLLYSKTLRAIADAYDDLNQFKNAEKFYQKCIDNRIELFTQYHIKTIEIQLDLANLYNKYNKQEQAKKLVEKMQQALLKIEVNNNPLVKKIKLLQELLDKK